MQKRGGMQWFVFGGIRIIKSGVGVHLTKVVPIADPEYIENAVGGVASIAFIQRQEVKGPGGDQKTDCLGGRIGQVEEMGLVFCIGVGKMDRIVGELGSPLQTRPSETPGHGRVHIRLQQVGRIEFVGHFRLMVVGGDGIVRDRVFVYIRKEIPFRLMACHQADGVPLEAKAIDAGGRYGIRVPGVLADVIE